MKTIILTILSLVFLSSPALGQDGKKGESVTIYNDRFEVQGYIRDGVIYDRNFRIQGFIGKDGKITDENFRTKGYVTPQPKGGGKRGK